MTIHPRDAHLVCFDNDGTLFASHEVANPAIQGEYVRFCAEMGRPHPAPTDEEICRLTGLPGLEFFQALLPPPLKEHAQVFRDRCLVEEVRHVLAAGRLFDGVKELLEDLRAAGRRLALVTNAGDRYIGAVAERCGYGALLDAIYHHGKAGLLSKRAMIEAALADHGGPAVMIGDRRSDLIGAREASVPFVGCLFGFGDPGELEGAEHLVRSIAELRRLLLA